MNSRTQANKVAPTTIADALDQTLDHIAQAHGLIDLIRKSASEQKGPNSEKLQRDVDRIWHGLDIAGTLTSQLFQNLRKQKK